jgi:hypothetical protein
MAYPSSDALLELAHDVLDLFHGLEVAMTQRHM